MDTSLPRFSKRASFNTKPNFSFSSGNASGMLASFNSSLMKTTLKIENNKDTNNNRSLGNILEELGASKITEQNEDYDKNSVLKNNSFSMKMTGGLDKESINKNSLIKIRRNSSIPSKKKDINNKSQLPALSEKSKSSKNNEIKIKEESIISNNNILEESLISEKLNNSLIKPIVICVSKIRDKRKSNKVFQSMEDSSNKKYSKPKSQKDILPITLK